jgi:hypothetical protein
MDTGEETIPAIYGKIFMSLDRYWPTLLKETIFALSEETADPGDHFEVAVYMPVTVKK